MRSNQRLIAVTLAAALLLSVVGPGLAVAQEPEEFGVEVNQENAVVVTVTDGDGAVANATVNVTVDDENATYEGGGEYETDDNGTVELGDPKETVNVTIRATKDNASATTDATLEPAENPEGDEEDADPFGQQLQDELYELLNGNGADVPGHNVAEWVTSNNPGNAPDHAGPKGDAGPPEHAGPDGDGGPPEHAKGGNDADDEDTEGAHTDDSDDDEEAGGESLDEEDDGESIDEEDDVDEDDEA